MTAAAHSMAQMVPNSALTAKACFQQLFQAFLYSCQKKHGSSHSCLMSRVCMQASAGPTSAVDATNTTTAMASMPRYCQNSTPKVTAAIMGTEHSSSRMPASQIWEASRVKISKKRAAPFLRGASLGTPGPSLLKLKRNNPMVRTPSRAPPPAPVYFFR